MISNEMTEFAWPKVVSHFVPFCAQVNKRVSQVTGNSGGCSFAPLKGFHLFLLTLQCVETKFLTRAPDGQLNVGGVFADINKPARRARDCRARFGCGG
jgi:hypothetical protein